MADMDNLLGSRISLISLQDVRYDGVLYSINQAESSIVLKDVRCLGTEDRVKDPALKVAADSKVIAFVSFPGNDIKDLFVHETTAEAPPANPPGRDQAFPPQRPSTQESSKPSPKPVSAPAPTSTAPAQQPKPAGADQNSSSAVRTKGQSSGVGTGQHLLHLRVKKADGATGPEISKSDFDFSAGLSVFNKSEILAKVAQEATVVVPSKTAAYSKDDFFDNISNERMDREEGRKTRLTGQEEKVVNQDTFGAIALQGGSGYRRYGGRGGRSGQQNGYSGRGGGRGRGDGRGRGRGNRAGGPQAQRA